VVAGDESSHLCFLERSFPYVDASFEVHQDLESEACSNVDTAASEASREAGLMMSKEMRIPPMLFQFHSEPSSLFV
jgi:uncharacterized membrane protein (UPF0127 family)